MFKLSGWTKRAVFVALAAGAALFANAYLAGAATAPSLGAAQNFAVLAGTTVTNVPGPATIGGDLGVSPGSAVTGQADITFTNAGMIRNAADSLAAQNAIITADNALKAQACTASVNTSLVGPTTLIPGVYCYDSSASLSGTVTLDALGDPGAVFIFNIVSTLTTATGSTVALINGAQPCNVFWNIGSSAVLFTNTTFVGTIIANASITLQSGASVSGRALAQTGAVTMLGTNNVSRPKTCAAGTTPTATPTAPATTSTPTATPLGATATPSTPGPTPRAPTAVTATATASTPTGPTATPTLPPVPGLPNAGGAPPQGGGFRWFLVLVASVVGGLTLHSSVRASRRAG